MPLVIPKLKIDGHWPINSARIISKDLRKVFELLVTQKILESRNLDVTFQVTDPKFTFSNLVTRISLFTTGINIFYIIQIFIIH